RFYISETIDDLESTDDYTCHFKTTDEGLESIGPFFSCLGLKSKLVSYVGTTFTIGVYAYCVFKPTKGGIWYSIILGNPLEKILGIVALAEPYMALLSWL
ncbi:MAG: hypothetical protein KAU14_01240, partial [Thermoplasmata archaeon]|nr:hypothetical protein [Thermoplasmata archaeon]